MNFKTLLSSAFMRSLVATTIWTTLAKSLGFLIPFFVAAWFGVTADTDVFFFAYGLIIFLTGIFGTALETVIVPFIAEHKAKDESQARIFAGNVLVLSFLALILLGIIFLLLARPFLGAITRFPPEQYALLMRILAETMPLLPLITAASMLSGTLNAHKMFWPPAIAPAVRAVMTIGIIFILKDKFGVHAIVAGYIAGEIFRILLLLVFAARKRVFSFSFPIAVDKKMVEFFKTISVQAFCLSMAGLNPVVDRIMASWLNEGSVSILYYADRLYMVPINLISAGFFSVALSYLSSHYYNSGDKAAILEKVKKQLPALMLICLLACLVLFIFRKPIISLSFARGKFPIGSFSTLEWTWAAYLVGLMPFVVGTVFFQLFIPEINTF